MVDGLVRAQKNSLRRVRSGAWVLTVTSVFLFGFEPVAVSAHADTSGTDVSMALPAAVAQERTALPLNQPRILRELLLGGTLAPAEVSAAWMALGEGGVDLDKIVSEHAVVLGALDGLPAQVRVHANRSRVPALMASATRELELVLTGVLDGGESRAQYLRNEITYLRQAAAGDVQLYLYERDTARVIEMVGTPGADTDRVITYVPGTFTGMNTFYTGWAQQISRYLVGALPGTVAFAYKDGLFPGENVDSIDPPNFLRVSEANDANIALRHGEQLAQFTWGVRLDPALRGVDFVGAGHSWGLVGITSAEVAGVEYDAVISLTGAGMLPQWEANPDTKYYDLSYLDLLQIAQQEGLVWEGKNPRSSSEFTVLPYYRGPKDDLVDDSVWTATQRLGALTINHNLIASDDPGNSETLEDLQKIVQ